MASNETGVREKFRAVLGAQRRRWCIFTSAGERNAIGDWLDADVPQWDLIVAYYGENDEIFERITTVASYAFRMKGSKYQNLKRFISEHPHSLDQYSHVWACDDDIRMSASQINEAFELTERLDVWVAQPAMRPEGKNGHWITCASGAQWDYRIVNYVENGVAIFRRDKLIEFLAVYDGSLTGWGIEWWYANLFEADRFGRFAIIDKVQVTNPRDEAKGGNEMNRLRAQSLREADWHEVSKKYGLVQYPDKVFAYCKLAPERNLLNIYLPMRDFPQLYPDWLRKFRRQGWHRTVWFTKGATIARRFFEIVRNSGWRQGVWFLRCGLIIRRQRRGVH